MWITGIGGLEKTYDFMQKGLDTGSEALYSPRLPGVCHTLAYGGPFFSLFFDN
jgi:hypothetical protein